MLVHDTAPRAGSSVTGFAVHRPLRFSVPNPALCFGSPIRHLSRPPLLRSTAPGTAIGTLAALSGDSYGLCCNGCSVWPQAPTRNHSSTPGRRSTTPNGQWSE